MQKRGWSAFVQGRAGDSQLRASGSAQVWATSTQGWRIGWLTRTEAWLSASEGAVRIAAHGDQGVDPSIPTQFVTQSRMAIWSGTGLQVGTPWMPMPTATSFKWRANLQGLKLSDLRTLDMDGHIDYRGGGQYDMQSTYHRVGPNITHPFVNPSAPSGWGGSLSFELTGNIGPTVQLTMSAQDVASRLRWRDLTTDAGAINTQNVQKNPDGTLDYAPRVTGQKFLADVTRKMDTHWLAQLRWSPNDRTPMSILFDKKSAITLVWLGIEKAGWHTQIEPQLRLAQMTYKNDRWNLGLGTDGRLAGSRYQFMQLSYTASF